MRNHGFRNINEFVRLDGMTFNPSLTIPNDRDFSITGILSTTTFTTAAEDNILVFTLSVVDELGGVDRDTTSVVVQESTVSIDENISISPLLQATDEDDFVQRMADYEATRTIES